MRGRYGRQSRLSTWRSADPLASFSLSHKRREDLLDPHICHPCSRGAPDLPALSFDRSLRQAGLCMPTDAGSLLIRRERGWASQVSLRPLPVAFLDLEDVALGVAEIASAAARLSVPFDPGDLLHPARNKLAARGFNVGHHIPILVAGLVVRRLAAALDELEHTRFAEIELDPARAGRQFGQPQHLAVEPALRIKIPGIRPSPPRSACSKTATPAQRPANAGEHLPSARTPSTPTPRAIHHLVACP